MAQYLSADLRIGAVEAGMSRNAAARRFGVSIASAVRWMDEYLRTGRSAPKPRGGDRRSGRIEAQAELLMRAIDATPDITLAELRERLITERGETFALSTIHDFYRRAFRDAVDPNHLDFLAAAMRAIGDSLTRAAAGDDAVG